MGIRRMAWSTSVLCLALLTCSSAWSQAAATASREREALRRVQRELQQNRQELAELKEKSAVLDKEKAGLASDNRINIIVGHCCIGVPGILLHTVLMHLPDNPGTPHSGYLQVLV